ncbi:hypothetical protein, conserved [Angomonas deanei]|uniref:Uncharacterized protein n=1 Tax=Angomonas deanei TaxID=59799 RepID=A0A7G2CKH3_9TRYP|nr:hypothetical protein, conserved [Angomonas deanei]
MIDNILISAQDNEETEFLRVVRCILHRIQQCHLSTTPDRNTLLQMSDEDLLNLSEKSNVFLGEEYSTYDFTSGQCFIRNSTKSVAKTTLSVGLAPHFTARTFACTIRLILFTAHTINMNPAAMYDLLKAYRAVYSTVGAGLDWDMPIPHLSPKIHRVMVEIATVIAENRWAEIASPILATYNEEDYDYVAFTDASAAGWGAVVEDIASGRVLCYQQQWIDELAAPLSAHYGGPKDYRSKQLFNRQHSAHAEPRAVIELLHYMEEKGKLQRGMRLAIVTDHDAIVKAQRKCNGFGGIGRGKTLNRLYQTVFDLFFEKGVTIVFFYIAGPQNPADTLSRRFQIYGESVSEIQVDDLTVPFLRSTYSPLAERRCGDTHTFAAMGT